MARSEASGEPALAGARARRSAVLSIYSREYAEVYPTLYFAPWPKKHSLNVQNIDRLLSSLSRAPARWLDIACGQAWHFSMFEGQATMVGVDISEAQLAAARAQVPGAHFVRADMAELAIAPGSFDLVTNFWGGYCYLRDPRLIAELVGAAARWTATGGSLYMELLLASDLAAFNRSRFASQTGFVVSPLSEDFSRWQYRDAGGVHVMASPPVETFIDVLAPWFVSVEARHDGAFMVHLMARGRRA